MKGKTQDSREKHLSCRSCGHAFTLLPPDDSYKDVYLKPCSENGGDPNHNYKQVYQCDNCHDRTEYYWCPGHFFVASSDYKVDQNKSRRPYHTDFD